MLNDRVAVPARRAHLLRIAGRIPGAHLLVLADGDAELAVATTATPYTGAWWSGKVMIDSLAARSQTFAVLSRLAVSRCLPSGLNVRPRTQSAWFSIDCSSLAAASPALRVPDMDHAIAARGRQFVAVRARASTKLLILAVEELLYHYCLVVNAVEQRDAIFRAWHPTLQIVDADVAFLPGPAAGDHQLAVRQEDHRRRPAPPACNAFFELAVVEIPDRQLMLAAHDDLLVVRREGQRRDR